MTGKSSHPIAMEVNLAPESNKVITSLSPAQAWSLHFADNKVELRRTTTLLVTKITQNGTLFSDVGTHDTNIS